MSVPQSNSTQTIDIPAALEDRTRLTSVAPLTADSTGNVTSVSTSSDAIPCASVMIVTVGAVRSGKTSTGISVAIIVPAIRSMKAEMRTNSLFCNENWMSLSNIGTSGLS